MEAMKWNPRYLAYATAHGRGASAMLEADREDWPGGSMAGFMLWLGRRWQEWAKLRGYRRTASGHSDTPLGPAEHADFDAWLTERAAVDAKLGVRSSRAVDCGRPAAR